MLHYTHPDNIEDILSSGLQTGRSPVQGAEAEWVLSYYDENPIYLTEPGSNFIKAFLEEGWAEYAAFEVDVRGLPLAADLPSLIDLGARHVEDGWLDLSRKDVFKPLLRYADETGCIEIEHLVDPFTDAAKEAIRITGTAVCVVSIATSRLALQVAADNDAGMTTFRSAS